MRVRPWQAALGVAALGGAWVAAAHPALAQAHNPFGVGISEGGGSAGGLTGWLLAEQAMFERQLSAAVRATRTDGAALWWLTGLSFLYGVFHAAGPGHGKAVMASYLFANERALRRGLVLSLLAALLQGLVAVCLVGVLALVLHATAQRMKDAASLVESLSYAGIAMLGAWLLWRKGRRFWAALRPASGLTMPFAARPRLAMAGLDPWPVPRLSAEAETVRDSGDGGRSSRSRSSGPRPPAPRGAEGPPSPSPAQAVYALAVDCGCAVRGAFTADAGHDPGCGHAHAPDPATLGDGFSWREAVLTVVAAGARPCSGAILVLVFAMAQGLFVVGVTAVLAMSLGTAITTGALATLAVLAKHLALRMTRPGSRGGLLVVRGLETAAAAVVLVAGLSLFLGFTSLGGP